MFSAHLLAVDVGASRLSCGQFWRGRGGQLELEQVEHASLEVDPAELPDWLAAVTQALREIGRRMSPRGEVHLVLPGHLAFARRVRMPNVPPAQRAAALAFEAAQNIPYPLDEVIWDHELSDDSGAELDLLLMAAKAAPMQALCGAVEAAEWPLARAIPSPVALACALRNSHPGRETPMLAIAVGAQSTQAVLVERTRLLTRTLPLGGRALTRDLAQELHLDFAQAESLKRECLTDATRPARDTASLAVVDRLAGQFAQRVGLEISRTIASAQQQGFAPPTAVFLTGGATRAEALGKAIAERLSLPVTRLDVWHRSGGSGPEEEQLLSAEAVGAAVAAGDRRSRANLLSLHYRKRADFRRRQPMILAVGAGLACGLLLPIWQGQREVSRLRAESATVQGQTAILREREQRHGASQAGLHEVTRQCDALRQVDAPQAGWAGFFARLQTELSTVEDVWLDRLDVLPRIDGDEPGSGPEVARPALRLRLSGRLLDVPAPSRAGSPAERRVQRLFAQLVSSALAQKVEEERFDPSQPGILRFDCTLEVPVQAVWESLP